VGSVAAYGVRLEKAGLIPIAQQQSRRVSWHVLEAEPDAVGTSTAAVRVRGGDWEFCGDLME